MKNKKKKYTRPTVYAIYIGEASLAGISHTESKNEKDETVDAPPVDPNNPDGEPDAKFRTFQPWADYGDEEAW